MIKTEQGARILRLLSVRGDDSDGAKRVREQVKAKLWAEETYQSLLLTLAEDKWLHEERFPLIERLRGETPNEFELMHLDALGILLGVPLCEPVLMIKKERAGEKRWHAAYLVLAPLKALLNA